MTMADERLTVPEVARRLGLPGPDVYHVILSGALDGGPDQDDAAYVATVPLAAYQRKAGLPVS